MPSLVLQLITGGLGMAPSEVDQLFSVFDADGSGDLDFREFCEVLDALPLQRTVDESPFGSAVSALQSLFILNRQLLQRLSIAQLAAAVPASPPHFSTPPHVLELSVSPSARQSVTCTPQVRAVTRSRD